MNVSIDPGISATGIIVWEHGKPVYHHTFWSSTRRGSHDVRCKTMFDRILDWLMGVTGGKIEMIVVELPEKFTKKQRAHRMNINSYFRGYLTAGLSLCIGSAQLLPVPKGTIPKSQARMLAKQFKLSGSQHLHDALLIGVLAGFHKE